MGKRRFNPLGREASAESRLLAGVGVVMGADAALRLAVPKGATIDVGSILALPAAIPGAIASGVNPGGSTSVLGVAGTVIKELALPDYIFRTNLPASDGQSLNSAGEKAASVLVPLRDVLVIALVAGYLAEKGAGDQIGALLQGAGIGAGAALRGYGEAAGGAVMPDELSVIG